MRKSPELRTFLLATFGLCWLLAGGAALAGLQWGTFWSYPVALTYMLIPGIVAIVIDKRAGRAIGESLWFKFRPNRWWLVAWLSPPLLAFAALAAALLIPGLAFDAQMGGFLEQLAAILPEDQLAEAQSELERFPFGVFLLIQLAQGLLFGATINAVFGLGEEVGWRGLMLRELAHKGFWTSAILIGVVWGIWHAPLILQGHNYPNHPVLGVAVMTLWCIALSPIFSWVTIKCRSVVAAGVMHGTLNATFAFSFIFLNETIELITGLNGLIGIAVLIIANLAILVFARPTLSASDWWEETAPTAAAPEA